MQLLPLEQVLLADNRHRRTFDEAKLLELAEDIATVGLLHAPVVRTDSEGQTWLVAGERRLRAISQLHHSGIPFKYSGDFISAGITPTVSLGELSLMEHEEAELSENICRVDLPWQERIAAEARLHALRQQQAQALGKTQTIKATADEIAGGQANAYVQNELSTSITIAKYLNDADVFKAESPREALKIIERKAAVAHREQLAALLGPTLTSSRHKLFQIDCFKAELPSNFFDILLTDPPYAVDAHNFGEQGAGALRPYEDSDDPSLFFLDIAKLASRICKPDAHSYIFCAFERFSLLQACFAKLAWQVWPRPLIWSKSIGVLPVMEFGPRYTYECILYARRGIRPVRTVGAPDVLSYTSSSGFGHPDEKPVDLYTELLRRSTLPGDTVVDPFAGTGPIFPAANRLQLTAYGCESVAATYAIAAQRIDTK